MDCNDPCPTDVFVLLEPPPIPTFIPFIFASFPVEKYEKDPVPPVIPAGAEICCDELKPSTGPVGPDVIPI